MPCGGTHRSRTFECLVCGYSRFHFAYEFADGDPNDRTRICADCGAVEGNELVAYQLRHMETQHG